MDKSKGHLGFADFAEYGKFEYFVRDGEVYKANVHNPVMADGYRCGRWECPLRMWEQWQKVYKIEFTANERA